MSQSPLQILLTGFGPFGKVIDNPTERLARAFALEAVAGCELTTCVFPTSFARAPELMRAQLEIGGRDGRPFDAVLMLGVASGSPVWRVEQFGRNEKKALEDADGFTPEAGPITPGAPEV